MIFDVAFLMSLLLTLLHFHFRKLDLIPDGNFRHSFQSKTSRMCGEMFCDKKIAKAEKTNRIQQGWEKIQELAKEWKVLQIAVDDKMYHFTKLYDKIVDQNEPFGVVHANCRIIFRNNNSQNNI